MAVPLRQVPEELTTWKEIAEYLGVTVRTAQHWEEERGLPVRRMPGPRGRVLARVAELEAWKQQAALPGEAEAPGAFFRSRPGILVLALVALAADATLWLVLRPAPMPAAVLHEADGFAVADAEGNVLWRKVLPGVEPPERYWEVQTRGERLSP